MRTRSLVSPPTLSALQDLEFTRPAIGMSTKEYIKTFKLSLSTPQIHNLNPKFNHSKRK